MKILHRFVLVFSVAAFVLLGVNLHGGDDIRPDNPVEKQIFRNSKFGLKTVKPAKSDIWTFHSKKELKKIGKSVAARMQRWGKEGPEKKQIPQIDVMFEAFSSNQKLKSKQKKKEFVMLNDPDEVVNEFMYRWSQDFKDVKKHKKYRQKLPFLNRSVAHGFYLKGRHKKNNAVLFINAMVFKKHKQTWILRIYAYGSYEKEKTFKKDIQYIFKHTELSKP